MAAIAPQVAATPRAPTGIQIGPPPPGSRGAPEVIKATTFAPDYRSIFTIKANKVNADLIQALKHVNCSYLSTPATPPSLTELKQHAQALTILIKNHSVSTQGGVIDNISSGEQDASFNDGETYDFLNDLTNPYVGPRNPRLRVHHNMPLTTLLNTLHPNPEENPNFQLDDICPLYNSGPKSLPGAPSLPYATHQSLISHANEVLELLDHEYSAKGGLLAILPPADQKAERKLAESTLLGQLILYVTRLVQRLHELERLYANTLDIIKSEAVVPSQALSALGPYGRKPRELVYPQDRFVLVNAGDDVWQFFEAEFQKRERIDQKVAEMYKAEGVSGEQLWERRGGREYNKGITAIDVVTRYYRLRKDPLKTVFIIPAWQRHPGVKSTRDMEAQPTVVSVVKPVWPERASVWEQKHRSDLEAYKKMQGEFINLKEKAEISAHAEKALLLDNQMQAKQILDLEESMDTLTQAMTPDGTEHLATVTQLREDLERTRIELQKAQDEKPNTKLVQDDLAAQQKALNDRRQALDTETRTRAATAEKGFKIIYDSSKRMDEAQAAVGAELHKKLVSTWQQQMIETQTIVEYLRRLKGKAETEAMLEGPMPIIESDTVTQDVWKKIMKAVVTAIPGVNIESTVPQMVDAIGVALGNASKSTAKGSGGIDDKAGKKPPITPETGEEPAGISRSGSGFQQFRTNPQSSPRQSPEIIISSPQLYSSPEPAATQSSVSADGTGDSSGEATGFGGWVDSYDEMDVVEEEEEAAEEEVAQEEEQSGSSNDYSSAVYESDSY